MALGKSLRIAVLGAGPIGIEAALQAAYLHYPVTIYEKGDIADHLLQWGHVTLFSPFGMNSTQLGLETIRREHPQEPLPNSSDILTGKDYRDRYLIPLCLSSSIANRLRSKTEVLAVGRSGFLKTDPVNDPKRATSSFRILLRDDKKVEQIEEADVILDCTGSYGQHRWLGHGGIPAIGEIAAEKQIGYGVEDILGQRKSHYVGRSVIVIGAGYSAATTVSNLALLAEDNPATWVFWLTRSPRGTPLPRIPNDPLKERDRLAARANSLAARGDGNLEYHPRTVVEQIESHGPDKGFRVTAKTAGKPMVWEVDRVIANVGYQPDCQLFSTLHVAIPSESTTIKQIEPNYFVLGMKSTGENSSFLLSKGYEQIREVFSLLSKIK